jgi:hypothetical protein
LTRGNLFEALEPRQLFSSSVLSHLFGHEIPLTQLAPAVHVGRAQMGPVALTSASITTSPTIPPIPGDTDGDGQVTVNDFLILQNNFNKPGTWSQGDFNGDGQVSIADFLILQNNFGFTLQLGPNDFWPSNPPDGGTYHRFPNASLFGSDQKISRDDFVQTSWVADCWMWAAFASDPIDAASHIKPDSLPNYYVVTYLKNGITYRVHINDELPEWNSPTTDGAIAGSLLEKAWAYIRLGLNTYTSLNTGFPTEVASTFGWSWNTVYDPLNKQDIIWNAVNTHVNAGKAVTVLTASTVNLVQSHCYTVVGSWTDGSGVRWIRLRNPWGIDGPSGDSVDDGYITITFDTYLRNTTYTCYAV